jgi:hypothetical protein
MEHSIAAGTSRDLVYYSDVWLRQDGAWQRGDPFPAPIVGSVAYDSATHQLILYARTHFQATPYALLDTTKTASWQAHAPDEG